MTNNINIDDLTYGQIKAINAATSGVPAAPAPQSDVPIELVIGRNYFFRTVTQIVTGRLVRQDKDFAVLADVAWIGDTGRYSNALASCEFEEVEPYPEGEEVFLNLKSVIDGCPIKTLPTKQK